MIWPTLSILIALTVAAIITTPDRPPNRTHIYWCRIPVLIVSAEGIEQTFASGPCGHLRITKSV